MTEKYIFETEEGIKHAFDNEEEGELFAYRYTIGNLVAKGFGEIVTVDGEEGFKINDRGKQWLHDHDKKQETIE